MSDLWTVTVTDRTYQTYHFHQPPETVPNGTYALVPVDGEVEAEKVWWCEVPEFNDDACHVGALNPDPANARQPRKHSQCRWVWLVEMQETDDE